MAYYTKLDLVSEHILSHLPSPRPSLAHSPPLMVAIQGPQGSGKTYITNQLRASLSAPPHDLKVAVLSIDDLYLPYQGLRALYELDNPMLKGRGLPGTHDVPLGIDILGALQRINEHWPEETGSRSVEIPSFDKSLHDGFGDRVAAGVKVEGPLDVVIFEGWFVGFYPLVDQAELKDKWLNEWAVEVERLSLGYMEIKFEDIIFVNEKLRDYVQLWEKFSVFVQVQSMETMAYLLRH
jgi:D-glycerate 3-kinase